MIGLLIEHPDELLRGRARGRAALIRRDARCFTVISTTRFNAPLLDNRPNAVKCFDRGRTTSLLLFEHVHAESRDQAATGPVCGGEKVGP